MNITITSFEFKKYPQEVRNALLREAVYSDLFYTINKVDYV